MTTTASLATVRRDSYDYVEQIDATHERVIATRDPLATWPRTRSRRGHGHRDGGGHGLARQLGELAHEPLSPRVLDVRAHLTSLHRPRPVSPVSHLRLYSVKRPGRAQAPARG